MNINGLLIKPLPALNDEEGEYLPSDIPPVVDAHVHLFPDSLFDAIWDWFEVHAWPIRYKLKSEDVLDFLFSKGLTRLVGLQYAHRPGVSRGLNRFMAGLCKKYDRLIGFGSVYPGEENAIDILREAFDMGLSGVKLHAHVQCFDMKDSSMIPIYEFCQKQGKPMIMHVGREPKSPAYNCDPYEICSAERVRMILIEFPELRICVPHMGADEFLEYRDMLFEFNNLWVDTTMAIADYLPFKIPLSIKDIRIDRIMFGTDFPNIPYAWDREIKNLLKMGLNEYELSRILSQNVLEFLNIHIPNP